MYKKPQTLYIILVSLLFDSLLGFYRISTHFSAKKGDSKWSAWNGKKGMTQNEAKQLYIAKTKSYSG